MDVTTFSVWAMPNPSLATDLQAAIRQLSTSYGGPIFPPHVTILGSIPHITEVEAKKRMKKLASDVQRYTLQFESIEMLPEFYRAIVIRMKHTKQVLAAFAAACKIFDYVDDPEHLCHLCLFYGHQTPAEKRRMMQDIYIDMSQSFPVNELHLYRKPQEALAWEYVESYKLKG